MRLRFALLLFGITAIFLGCATAPKNKVDLTTPRLVQYVFQADSAFEIYDYFSRRTIGPDGTLIDWRLAREKIYLVFATDPEKGAVLQETIKHLEYARFVSKEMTGKAKARMDQGIIEYKGDPGVTQEALEAKLGKTRYLMVNPRGLVVGVSDAEPKGDPFGEQADFTPRNSPLAPPYPLMGFEGAPSAVSVESTWKSMLAVKALNDAPLMELALNHRVAGGTNRVFQIVTYGSPGNTKVSDDIEVKSATYFAQTIFDTRTGFVQSNKSETEMEYRQGGRLYRETIRTRSNNSLIRKRQVD